MHRLWFRLDDVLPLAEHAMACFTHRVTGSQAAAQAPHGPALAWTSSPMMDLLTSNGLPAWHGSNGVEQAAEAYTWRTTSGGYGTAWRDDYHGGHLPLSPSTGGHALVMSLLRGARHSGNHWVTIDIDPTDMHLIPAHRVQVVACRHEIVPVGTTWTSTVVTCSDVNNRPYPALVADGYRSDNGALLARFDQPTIARIATDLDVVHANPDRNSDPMPGEYPILHLDAGMLTVIEQRDHGLTIGHRITDRLTPDADGYYPLGAYLWHWQDPDADQDELG